jgi:acyl-CoA synthetase (AMP-forming)/AMP-acid ligase II
MNLGEILAELARARPDAVALVDENASRRTLRRLTFAQLETEVAHAAGWLKAHGLKRGDAVLVFVPMSAELYIALLAMFRLGVVALFLDPSAGREHLERCCARWKPSAFLAIAKAHLLRLRSAALQEIPRKFSVGFWVPGANRWLGGAQAAPVRENLASADDAALVTFTSGSTGIPKAAVRTHGFLLAQFQALAPNIELHAGEIDLAALPVFTLANLAARLTTVIPCVDVKRPGEVDAAALCAQIEREGVTRLTASPALFEQLIAHARATQIPLPTLTKIHTGGAPVFPRLLNGLRDIAPNARIVAVYGSTEAEPVAHIALDEMTDQDLQTMRSGRGLLTGRPVPQVRVRVITDRWGTPREPMTETEFAAETLPPNNPGEIVVTGTHVLRGYLGGIGDEETKFKVGAEIWHRTGDAGLFDESGRLWLLGRCSAHINDARGRLYPFGVECAAMGFAEVRRAAVLSHRGRRLLMVEMISGSAHDLVERLQSELQWAQLDAVHVVEQLPMDSRHNAKIDYPALRKLVERLELV